MLSVKSVVGVIGGLLAVLYFGGLLYYFVGTAGSIETAQEIGLGPTLLGLGLIGLVFCIVLIARIVRIFFPRGASATGGRGDPGASTKDDEGAFDADAVIARHMARRPAEAASTTPTMPPGREGGGSTSPQGFGRRVR